MTNQAEPPTTPRPGQNRPWLPLRRLTPTVCCLVFFFLALNTALSKTPTADEPVHVLRGLTLWQTRDLVLQTQPPLSHWLIGSLVSTEPDLPDVRQLASWPTQDRPVIAHELFWERGLPVERIILLARLPIIFVGMLLGAILARWAREQGGRSAPGVVLFLFSLSPNILASASLATTDLTITTAYVAVVFAWWRFWQRPSRGRWLLAALCLGLALGAKLTALLLLPITLPLSYCRTQTDRPWWRTGLIWASLLPVAGLVVWALYGFEARETLGLPFPIPAATYLDNFFRVQEHVAEGHQAFLLGELSRDGWWYYFVVALLIKTPLLTLMLALAAAVSCIRGRHWARDAFLWMPAGSLFLVASYTRLNIGYRHILPVLAFSLVWGASWAPTALRNRRAQIVAAVLLVWYALSGLRQHPHHLAYFNELVGGSAQGYRYLGDSNLDWGQDLNLLADYIKKHESASVFVGYFGSADPLRYGLDDSQLLVTPERISAEFAPANPAAGLYAISTNHLQGLALTEPDLFDWFRHRQPVDQLGYSILIYQVEKPAAGTWIGHCLDPAPLLDQASASHLLGQTAVRHVYFDCRSSWVFPNRGQPGWYLLPQQAESWPLAERSPDNLTLLYSHSATATAPSYEIHYWQGALDPEVRFGVSSGRVTLTDGSLVALPVAFDDTAQLVGFRVDEQDWWTAWKVLSATKAPLSVAAHLYPGSPSPQVADGLGYSSEQWQPGDLFIQFHNFTADEGAQYLETGLYNYLSGDRLPLPADLSGAGPLRLYPD
jgi:4-amino-4-deoxy-L-arabinose transferase-like glycosyltransferase